MNKLEKIMTLNKYLLAELAIKDDEAFVELYHAFFHRVYNFVYSRLRNSADADELTNDIFYKVFRNLDTYAKGGGGFFFYGVAFYRCATYDY